MPPREPGFPPQAHAPRSSQHHAHSQEKATRQPTKREERIRKTRPEPRKRAPTEPEEKGLRWTHAPAWTDLEPVPSEAAQAEGHMRPASTPMRFQDSQTPRDRGRAEASRAQGTAGSRGQSGQQGPGTAGSRGPVSGDRAFGDHEQGLPAAGGGPALRAFNAASVRLHMDKKRKRVLLNGKTVR